MNTNSTDFAATNTDSGFGSCSACGTESSHQHHHEQVRLSTAVIGGILVLNSYLADTFFAHAIDPFAIELSAIIGALILSAPIFISAVRDLLSGNVYMNELVGLAVLAALASQQFITAGTVAFLMLVTITVERRTAIGAEASLESLIRLTPQKARLLKNGKEREVDVSELTVDDIFRVRPGENYPADGVVINGTSTVNQASITGESLPVDKFKDDEVYAGTQNLNGVVEVRVTRAGEDTTLGKVKELIVAAEKSRLPFMRMIDRYAGFYTPVILMLAALVWFVTQDLNRVIAVLVVACPCALIVAAPSAVVAAIAAAARLGILIKDVSHIELASRLKSIVFDKTGTLTEGVLEVARLQPAENVELAELLQTATATECHSNHPAAQAMRRLAEEAGIEWDSPTDYKEIAGKGVEAKFNGDVCRVGRESWLSECGVNTENFHEELSHEDNTGMSIIFVTKNNKILGWIGLRDAAREGAREAISEIKNLGITQTTMFTGDNRSVADLIGGKTGISDIHAECLPQEKVQVVEAQRKKGGYTAVVGDGVNDAPALAAGDIGIAMGAIGSDVAVNSASIALMNNDLRRIPFLIWLSRKARTVMAQNIGVGISFIAVGLYLAAGGVITPVLAALFHTVGTIFVIFNSARLVRTGEYLDPQAEEENRTQTYSPDTA
ncbi:MAG: heavy metal translocating P-type ATPase [Lentisphaeria bacterium]